MPFELMVGFYSETSEQEELSFTEGIIELQSTVEPTAVL